MRCKRFVAVIRAGAGAGARAVAFAVPVAICVAAALAPSLALGQGGTATDSYARYVSPAQCVQTAVRMRQFYWRDKHIDTARTVTVDAYPLSIRDSVRMCASRFSAAAVLPDQLAPLVELALILDDTVTVNAAAARAIATVPSVPPEQRAARILYVVKAFLEAKPRRIDQARHYARVLDSMGASAIYERMKAGELIASALWVSGQTAAADTQSRAAIAASKELSEAEQFNFAFQIRDAYVTRSRIVLSLYGRDSALAFIDTAHARTIPLTHNGGPHASEMLGNFEGFFRDYRKGFDAIGRVSKPVHAESWLGTAVDSVYPKPGRVTVFLFSDPDVTNFELVATLRRLRERYAGRDVDFVYSTYTAGYFRGKVEPTPADEVKDLKRWFVDFINMPVTVAVEESQFGRLIDGRRQNVDTENRKNYYLGSNVAIIGKDGKRRAALSSLGVDSEEMYYREIDEALADMGGISSGH